MGRGIFDDTFVNKFDFLYAFGQLVLFVRNNVNAHTILGVLRDSGPNQSHNDLLDLGLEGGVIRLKLLVVGPASFFLDDVLHLFVDRFFDLVSCLLTQPLVCIDDLFAVVGARYPKALPLLVVRAGDFHRRLLLQPFLVLCHQQVRWNFFGNFA